MEFDRYIDIEKELGSTFYFIPYPGVSGRRPDGPVPKRRAVKYDIGQLKHELQKLTNAGCEIGLHGLDAWLNVESAHSELRRIGDASGMSLRNPGTRMHWLYWTEGSATVLDNAGFSYDSTCGYNEAVGFRAGTAQTFCPLPAQHLLELPLIVQDSALFYQDRMNLSECQAMVACKGIIQSLVKFGGVLTINWHTRSLSPERLWGDFYIELLQEIQQRHVWFATASQIVQWFRQRRAIRFQWIASEPGYQISMDAPGAKCEKPFTLRIHEPTGPNSSTCRDLRWDGLESIRAPVELPV